MIVSKPTYQIYDNAKQLIARVKDADDSYSSWLNLQSVPLNYQRMVLQSEDKWFYFHPGINPIAIVRAGYTNYKSSHIVLGASTITQQLAKLLLGSTQHRYYGQKIKEILLALCLELKYSKKQILEAYLNNLELGYQNKGIENASRFYFAKNPKVLSLSEWSSLIIIARSPSRYDPFLYSQRLTTERNKLLKVFLQANLISREEYDTALSLSPNFRKNRELLQDAQFVRYALSLNKKKKTNIYTTLDSNLQQKAQIIMSQELQKLRAYNVGNVACLIASVKTGAVLAYVGSSDFFDKHNQGQLDGVQALFQPGSTLKPFVYAYAFTQGYTPASLLLDKPLKYSSNGGYYIPKNYSESYYGQILARFALANSLNLPTLYLADQLNLDQILILLRKVGLKSLNKPAGYYGLGLVLGNGEVSLWELTQAYMVLANQGLFQPLHIFNARKSSTPKRIFSPEVTYLVTNILSDSWARRLSFGDHSYLNQNFPSAVKTGTTTNFRDNWCIGYTNDFLVGVWAGNFNNAPMRHVSGVTGAAPIWHRLMELVNKEQHSSFVPTAKIVKRLICFQSGGLSGSHCQQIYEEVFTKKMASHLQKCTLTEQEHNPNLQIQAKTYEQPNVSKITFPQNNSYFAFDPRIDAQRQRITFEYFSKQSDLYLTVDGQKIQGVVWQLTTGNHTLRLYSRATLQDTSKFTVY